MNRRRWCIWIVMASVLGAGAARGDDAAGPDVDRPPAAGRLRIEPIGLSTPSRYTPGKVPVVFVHGFWVGPRTWEPMIRALEADPEIAAGHQFWTFGYATGDPLPYSAYRMRLALDEVRRRLDPDRADRALDRMVVVGHSMGGVLAKLLTVDSGDRFWRLVSAQEPDRLAGEPADVALVRETLVFRARPEVQKLVFIATPHRGGTADQEILHDVASRLVRKPDPLRNAYRRLIAANPPDFFTNSFRASLITSIDEMRWNSPMLAALNALRPASAVSMHSIIPIKNGPPGPGGDDGLIAFASAHLDGVASEMVVAAGHFCIDDSRTFAEVRRILKAR
ncbi:esterase/lipase family protein [Paludisphaera mucosa]|uniref:Alpha/beta hydrolase n=1 Tax=Paludisphaera mucosa TaxID=3030827 RepID=A0ABT6FDC7_9BACT|nr:alpha/beta hydrolase [Paludisphaera mucosa]MDG3005592.1 alpha/beta hydrolase [Paludisphaera mucosa]